MKSSKKPTQHDVARLAGVSTAVVSRVLNPDRRGTVRVGRDAEERVRRAMEELGYVPNPVARNLATGRTHLIGVFTYEPIFPTEMRDFYFPFLVGIERAAERRGFDLLLFTSSGDGSTKRSAYRDGVNRLQLADGAILLGRNPDREELGRLAEEGFPIVYVGRREIPRHDVSYVAADYAGSTADLTTYLVELGHRRIAYLGAADVDESSADREKGYRATLDALGLAGASLVGRTEPARFDETAFRGYLDQGVTAFLLENDRLARQLEVLAGRRNVAIPKEVSFAVLGDPLDARQESPSWTRFRIPRESMGARSLDLLLDIIDDPMRSTRRVVLPCTFMPGSTTARAAQPPMV